MIKKILKTGALMLVVTSCSTTSSLYNWDNYVDTSYNYYKKQTPQSEEALLKTYKKIIGKPKGSRKVVPPGIYSEYGFILIQAGKKEEGIALMKKEIEQYPESKAFIERIIKQFDK